MTKDDGSMPTAIAASSHAELAGSEPIRATVLLGLDEQIFSVPPREHVPRAAAGRGRRPLIDAPELLGCLIEKLVVVTSEGGIKLRTISARGATKRERRVYEQR